MDYNKILSEAKELITKVEMDLGRDFENNKGVVNKLVHIENLIEQCRSDLEEK